MAKKVTSTVPEENISNPIADFLGKERKKAIASGKEIDPEIIKASGAPAPTEYGGTEQYHPSLQEGYFDPYEDYINPHTLRGGNMSLEEMNQMRFENQTLGQEVGHALGRVGVNILPQILSGYASMVDIPGYFDAEHAANNTIVNWADSLKKDVDENMFPIYTDPNGDTMDLTSSAWWASRGSGLVESVGSFLAQGAGMGKALNIIGEGIGTFTKGAKLLSTIEKIPGVKSGADVMTRLGQGTKGLAGAIALNQSEAVIEATQVYKQTYEDGLKANLNEQEARERAANAAATTMNLNRINILLNLSSASAFLTPLKTTRNLLKEVTTAGTIAHIGKEMGQEAAEELINHVASQAGIAEGKKKEYTLNDAFKDMGSMQGIEAAFLGAIGGMAQTTGTNLLQATTFGPGATTDENGNKISKRAWQNQQYQKQQEVINDLKSKGVKINEALKNVKDSAVYYNELSEAIKSGDTTKAKELMDNAFETQVLKAAESGTAGVLEELYQAEARRDVNEVGEEYIQNAKDAVKNLRQLEGIYNNYSNYTNVQDIFYNRANAMRNDRILNATKQSAKEDTINLDQDIRNIARKYSFEQENNLIIKNEGEVVRIEPRTKKVPLPYTMNDIENNPGTTEENKAVYDQFLKEVQELPSYKKTKEYEDTISSLETDKVALDKQLSELQSPKAQEEGAKKQKLQEELTAATNNISKINSIQELNDLKTKFNDKDFNRLADAKIEELKQAQVTEVKNKKINLAKQQILEKLKVTDAENLENLRNEVRALKIPQTHIAELLNKIDARADELSGNEPVENPFENFTSTQSADEEEVTNTEKAEDTQIPTDIPAPNQEAERKNVTEEVEKLAAQIAEDKENTKESVGEKIYNYFRAKIGAIRAAYLSREFNQRNDMGVVSREEITNEIQNLQVLDPNTLTPGTKITLKVKTDYKGEKYNPESDTKETFLWSEREKELIDKYGEENYRQSEEYLDEVPIVAVDENGNEVFYVHDTSWIKEENLANDAEGLEDDRNNLKAIRREVINNGSIDTIITFKGNGRLIRSVNNEQLPVSEAMPDSDLIINVAKDGIYYGPQSNLETVGPEPQQGRVYAMVPIGPGQQAAIPLSRTTLKDDAIESIIQAIEAYLAGDENNPIVQEVARITNGEIDLTDITGLRKYVSQFTMLTQTNKNEGLEPLLNRVSDKLDSNHYLLAITGNTIEFGRPKVAIAPNIADKKQAKAGIISKNFNKENNKAKVDALRAYLKKMLSNVDRSAIILNGDIALIATDGTVTNQKYTDFVKSTHTTNILSINIGTEDNPKWAYTIQPTILFSDDFVSAETKQKLTQPTKTTSAKTSEEIELEEKIKAFDKTIEPEYEEGDYSKVLILAEKQVANGTIPQTPENVQLITNYPKLFEEFIKATDARNKTIEAFDKEAVLAGQPKELPIYGINATVNKATGRLDIQWVEVRKETITNIQSTKLDNYAALELLNYKNKLKESLTNLQDTSTSNTAEAKKADIERRRQASLGNGKYEGVSPFVETQGDDIGEGYYLDDKGNEITTFQEDPNKKWTTAEIIEWLNKKYDAELDALEEQPAVSDIEAEALSVATSINNIIESKEVSNTIDNFSNTNLDRNGKENLLQDDIKDIVDNWGIDEESVSDYMKQQGTTLVKAVWRNNKTQFFNLLESWKKGKDLKEKLAALEGSTAAEEVGETAVSLNIDNQARDFISANPTITADNINNILEQLQQGVDIGITAEEVSEATAMFERVLELLNNSGRIIEEIDGIEINIPDIDISEFDEDEYDGEDEAAPDLSDKQINQQRKEIEDLLIRGLDPRSQESLVSYLSALINQQALLNKEKTGKSSINTKEIFDKQKAFLTKLSALLEKKGLVNKAKRVRMVLDQWSKVKKLVGENISLLNTGTISQNYETTDGNEAGLERTSYSDDFTFTVDSKKTASADLRKFFAFVEAVDEQGRPISSIIGLPEIVPFDTVYNTLHEVLANLPADFDTMMKVLRNRAETYPWINNVIKKLEEAPEKIKNEFVSDMAKFSLKMEFVMWSKDKSGNYSLGLWSSNSSAIEQRLRDMWSSNLKGTFTQSNLVVEGPDGNYVFNKEIAKNLIDQAAEWKKNPPSKDAKGIKELAQWLGNFGIVLSDRTYNDLIAGKFKNRSVLSWQGLFNSSNGIVSILSKKLDVNLETNNIDDVELFSDTVIKNLAKFDARNVSNVFSNSFQAGTKSVYSYTNGNYALSRVRDLTALNPDGTFVNQELIDKLKRISFTSDSLWLEELTAETPTGELMRDSLGLSYVSLEALKQQFTASQDNRKLNKLSDAEHEVVKLGMFFNNTLADTEKGKRRIVSFLYPTMSDKSTMTVIRALAQNVKLTDGELSEESTELLYKAIVLPELSRMMGKQPEDIAGYNPNYFYFLPSLNDKQITIGEETKSIRDFVLDGKAFNEDVKAYIKQEIQEVFKTLVENKLSVWEKLGIGVTNKETNDVNSFLNKGYMSNIAKGVGTAQKVKYAASDFIFNYLIANAESFKLIAGDPALFYKASKKENATIMDHIEETYINLGKRLAKDIAPGLELADSQNNKYYQVFFNDKKMASNNVSDSIQKEYFDKIIKNFSKNYSGIEGSDAQEYTTWREHLYVLNQLGRITQKQYNTIKTKLENKERLSEDEAGLVFQPLKPVYTGNIADVERNVDRVVYIKSSSFPLIPQLTEGLEIDKVREALEVFEEQQSNGRNADGSPVTVRASFGTANKVGAIKNAVDVFNEDGSVKDNLSISESNALLLPRSNFRIQQDIPYKVEKNEVNIGTQERKLLFVNMLDVEIEPGVNGEELFQAYNNAYENLFVHKYEKLMERFGLVETTIEGKFDSMYETSEESTIFDRIIERDNQLANATNPVSKKAIKAGFEEAEGELEASRADYINKNFDKIVEILSNSNVETLFVQKDKFDKNCE